MSKSTFFRGKVNGGRGYGRASYAEVQEAPTPHYWWDECGYWSIVTPIGQDVTNLIRNPSMEISTDGWAGNGLATVATTTVYSAFGRQSLEVNMPQFLGAASVRYTGGPFPALTLTPGQTLYFTVWVKAPVDSTITVDIEHTAGAPGQVVSIGRTVGEAVGNDQWVQLAASVTYISSSPALPTFTATPRVTVNQTGTVTPFSFYVDGAMATIGNQVDSYFDGSTGGGTWNGAIDASTSTLSRFRRGYGKLNNFTEIGLDIIGDSGYGIPGVEGISSSYATLYGRHFQRQRYLPRVITLVGIIQGCCISDVPQKRRVIQRRMLYNFEAYCNEGLTLSYQLLSPCCHALTRRVEMRGMQYSGGMEADRNNQYFDRVLLQFTGTNDPFWTDPIEVFFDTDPAFGNPTQVTHESTAPVFPVIQFTYFGANNANFPLAGGGLINDTIEQTIKFTDDAVLPLTPNTRYILDTNPESFRFEGFDGTTTTDYSSLIDYERATLGLPMIVPGTNSIRADFDGPVPGSVDITWRFNQKYLAADDVPLLRTCCACGNSF